jgi:TetR/AcrR family transcriptional regulator, fatty acid metabolism regulator protein
MSSHRSDVIPRRLQILTAARHLLAADGYDHTTMAGIASEVGIVESALYRHFASKRELFDECVRVFYEPIISDLEQAEQAITDPRAMLRYIVHRHLRSFVEGPELNQLVIMHARQVTTEISPAVKLLNRRYTSVLIRAIEAGIDEGIFRQDLDTHLVRDLVYGFIEHTWLRLRARGEPVEVSRQTAQALALIEPCLFAQGAPDIDVKTEIQRLSQLVRASLNDVQSGTPPGAPAIE